VSERMTDDVFSKWMGMEITPSHPSQEIQTLWNALKAERAKVVELEATIRRVIPGTPATESDWVKLVGEKEALEARIKVLEALAGDAK